MASAFFFIAFVFLITLKLSPVNGAPNCGPIVADDTDRIQFALNLEFLEAEFFLNGALGHGLDSIEPSYAQGGPPPIGATKANLDPLVRQIFEEFGYQEVGHLRAIITRVGGIPRPLLDLSPQNFAKIFDEAAGFKLSPPFDPYLNTVNYLLATYVIPYVGLVGYVGTIPNLSKKSSLSVPGLAVVIVGNRKDSQSYVSMKRKACAEVGIKSFDIDLPEQVSEADLVAKVHELNANPDVHGILVQLPLPKHINEERVLTEISIEKDVDGFHPLNIGKLAMKGREPLFHPCTPKGCLELLSRSGITIKGKKVVVVGRSNIVGLPVSLLLLKADATVTIVHSHSQDPERIIREADIIIAAAGKAMMVKGSWIKPGAAVIDVGTNAIDDPSKKSGYRLVGDVDFQEACKVAGWITPVPGGVGPMTVAMLLKNTLEGAKRVIEP